ncbi:MAG: hypothetical protein JWO18_485 [Microbacteriaceae bacterium]|nr:hypothetical protein [Microbacteriaceae bacterium]
MEHQGYLRIFRDRWLAIVIGALLGVWAAAAVGASIPPTYSATATLFLSVQSDAGSLNERSQFALARISSYPELATSSDVLSKTISELGLTESVQQLGKSITATNPPTTVLLQIGAEAGSAKQAADIANSVATNLASVVSDLENSPNDSRYAVALQLKIPAQEPTGPSAPQLSIILGLGLVAGLALGLIAAIVWARLDTGIRTVGQVRRISGLPVLGQLPWLRTPFGPPRARHLAKRESLFRESQLTIRQANAGVMPDVLVLVPASRAAGKPGVRVGFAREFAATGRSVCLVEGDFGGGIDSIVPTAREATGLAEVLGGGTTLKRVVSHVEGENFSLIPPGDPADLPKEYDAEHRVRGVIRELVSTFDITVIQATSTTRPASLQLVGPYADGLVVLVRYGRTRSADLAHVLSRLRVMGVRPLGVVMTGVPPYRRSDLAAGWLPGDFNETRRTPLFSLDHQSEGETAHASKRRTTARRRSVTAAKAAAAAAAAAAAVENDTLQDTTELPIDEIEQSSGAVEVTEATADAEPRQTSSVD